MAPVRPRCYFLTPTTDVPPRGPIRLGSLISIPRLVTSPINAYPVPPGSAAEPVYLHNMNEHSVTIDKSSGSHGGIFAEFLHGLGISGKIEGKTRASDKETWAFHSLQTIWFDPSLDYVKTAVQDMDVQNFVMKNKTYLGRKQLYMVIGVKVAYGAFSTLDYIRNKGLELHVGFDFTPLGAPITVGPDVGAEQQLTVSQFQRGGDPFVFAFRLRRVLISQVGEVKQEDFNKGAMLSIGGGPDNEQEKVNVVVEGLEDFDVDSSTFGLQGSLALDEAPSDETECTVAKSA